MAMHTHAHAYAHEESPDCSDNEASKDSDPDRLGRLHSCSCDCCPFGYHVDVGFVEYANSVLTPRPNARRVEELRDKRQRRSRQSKSLNHMLGTVSEECRHNTIENETNVEDWTEVEATQAEIGTGLQRLSSHLLSCHGHKNEKELQDLQEKVKSLTIEIWNLKHDRLPVHSASSIAVQVNESDLYDAVGQECTEKADIGTQVTLEREPELEPDNVKAKPDPEAPEAMPSRPVTVSRIPRLKTPKNRSKQQSPRSGPSEEMQFAFNVLNEAVINGYTNHNAVSLLKHVADEWFQVGAAKSGNLAAIREYLHHFEKYYAPQMVRYIVNMVDEVGNTVLHYAVSNGNFDVVSALLDSSAVDPDKLNNAGYSALMLVTIPEIKSNTDRSVVRWLLSVGDVNARAAQHGQTTLMLAAAQGRLETVRLLVEAGAAVNLQDEDGSTALMCAAEHGHGDVIRFLLTIPDCDPNQTDNDGYTALAVAMEAGNKELAVILYAHMNFPESVSPSTLSPSPASSSPRKESTNSNFGHLSF